MKISRILLVDDDPFVRRVAEISLAHNFEGPIKAVSSGSEALTVLSEFRPDLILLDLSMPDMDGMDVLQQLHHDGSTIPVIVMSASVSETERAKLLAQGAKGILAKPFDPMRLAQSIQSILVNTDET